VELPTYFRNESQIYFFDLSKTKATKRFREAEKVLRFEGKVSGFGRRKTPLEIIE
jgi:hypothetical protein